MISTEIPIPEVFVLWHPRCALGEPLARAIYAWLRPRNGLGPEVFYRSLPAPGAPERGLPPPLPGEKRGGSPGSSGKVGLSNLQLIIPLIDDNMVSDSGWRHWLTELARQDSGVERMLVPVALDPTAYNMPAALRELNYLRPAGLPLASAGEGAGLERVSRSLCKQLTEAMCRVLLPRPRKLAAVGPRNVSEEQPKVTIFLSHAKSDGTGPVLRLRDYIYSQTQLAAFYDENDIAFGSVFSRVIRQDVSSPDTAALIAVRSEQYANRPWCRRELSLFRTPRREGPAANGIERWRLFPALVVEAMEAGKSSGGISELGNSPSIRWSDSSPGLEEMIVTSVIRDAMLAAFHSALGAAIVPTSGAAAKVIINWLPDPTTLLHIPQVRSGQEVDLIHPGRGLSGMDLETLSEYFPATTFHSFEEVLT